MLLSICDDPTPGVVGFMEAYKDNSRLIFKREGIYTEDGELKLYTSSNPAKLNSSLYPIHGQDGQYEVVLCKKLTTILKENGHSNIDILKMDIEGVADDVLKSNVG